jgi:hypothetical protein
MWKRLLVRVTVALLLTLLAVALFDYLSFSPAELPLPHTAALRAHVARDVWEESELFARRVSNGYAVTLSRRNADGRWVVRRYEVGDTLEVKELGVSISYPPQNAVNILLALTLGLILCGYAALSWFRQRKPR